MSVKGFSVNGQVEKYDYNELENKPTIPTVPVQSVNTKTGAVTLDADDVGAIAAPSSPTSGQFLVFDGTAWVARTVPSAQGVSF